MAQRPGSAWDGAYDVHVGGIGGQRREAAPSSSGPGGRVRNGLTFRRRKFTHRPRSDLGPSLSQAGRLTHAIEESLFVVVAPPAPTVVGRENAPFDARPARATSGRPRRVHAQVAVPTWRSRVATFVATWGRLIQSTRKQRRTAHTIATPEACNRIAWHHNPSARCEREPRG